jgi:hypothetical protein
MISHKLVTEFGGKLLLNSEVGKGSIFTFSILLKDISIMEDTGETKTETVTSINSKKLCYEWKPPSGL